MKMMDGEVMGRQQGRGRPMTQLVSSLARLVAAEASLPVYICM